MDTQISPEISHKHHLFKFLKVLIIVLTVFVGLKALNTIKEYGYIGRGVVATNVITVSGKGEILATPNIADFSFSVSQDAKTAQDAQDTVSTKSSAILAAVKSAGVDDKDVKTLSYDLSPKYEYSSVACVPGMLCPQGKQIIVGYTVTETVEVKVRKIDDASALIAKITTLGASNISDVSFTVDNQDSLTDQARAQAITDAQTKAKTLAHELGVHLGDVVNFSDNSGGPIYYAKAMSADNLSGGALEAPVPNIPSGQNTITSNVSITYEIN